MLYSQVFENVWIFHSSRLSQLFIIIKTTKVFSWILAVISVSNLKALHLLISWTLQNYVCSGEKVNNFEEATNTWSHGLTLSVQENTNVPCDIVVGRCNQVKFDECYVNMTSTVLISPAIEKLAFLLGWLYRLSDELWYHCYCYSKF